MLTAPLFSLLLQAAAGATWVRAAVPELRRRRFALRLVRLLKSVLNCLGPIGPPTEIRIEL
jgi:hypothetical protein